MPYKKLGRNGPFVSRFAPGTMTFGAETPEKDTVRQPDLFADRGGTFVDTADVYYTHAWDKGIEIYRNGRDAWRFGAGRKTAQPRLVQCWRMTDPEDSLAVVNLKLEDNHLDAPITVSATGLLDYLHGFLEAWSKMDIGSRLGT